METCANPGCDQPGTNKCSGCKTTPYCGPTCQKDHWPIHKESCDGRLRKMGMDHLAKAKGFYREQNYVQILRYSDLAATKLKQLKDHPIEAISEALCYKCEALGFLAQYREQLESAKECYSLWNTKPTDVGAIGAIFLLIDSCMHNNEFADAVLYSSTLLEIINHKHDNKIPDHQQQPHFAQGAYYLATATLHLARDGGILPEEKQKAGDEAIALVRRALEIHTQLKNEDGVASDMVVLADSLGYFKNDGDDEEVLRLYEQAKVMFVRLHGSSSVNVALSERNLGIVYWKRAERAHGANDLDRELANLELSLPRYREAVRIYRVINHVDRAIEAERKVSDVEEKLRRIATMKAAAAAASKG